MKGIGNLSKAQQKRFVLCTSKRSEDGSTECFGGSRITGWALGHAKFKFRSESSVLQSTNHIDAFPLYRAKLDPDTGNFSLNFQFVIDSSWGSEEIILKFFS